MHHTFTRTSTLLGIAAACAIVLAPSAGAAAAPKVTGAYLYIQKIQTSSGHGEILAPYATLVFRTDQPLPRRYDGLIRAGAGVAGQNGSVGAVHGKASRCYQVNARIKQDNTITGTSEDGSRTQTTARAGTRLPVTITTTKDATAIKRTLTLRKAKPGDASGKPLGC